MVFSCISNNRDQTEVRVILVFWNETGIDLYRGDDGCWVLHGTFLYEKQIGCFNNKNTDNEIENDRETITGYMVNDAGNEYIYFISAGLPTKSMKLHICPIMRKPNQ